MNKHEMEEMENRLRALKGSRNIILHLLQKKRAEINEMELQTNVLLKDYNAIEKEYAELKLKMIKEKR